MIIVVGVAGDIVVSTVRSYSKTQITNELEQNGNFLIQKLQRELRSADSVESVSSNELSFYRREDNGSRTLITYTVTSAAGIGLVTRAEGAGAPAEILTNNHAVTGVNVDPVASSFALAGSNPDVVEVNFTISQVGNPTIQFTQDFVVSTTIVVRGSY